MDTYSSCSGASCQKGEKRIRCRVTAFRFASLRLNLVYLLLISVGADFLESFCVPGLWLDEDVARIAKIGIVAVARNEIDHEAVFEKHKVLKEFRSQITLVQDVIPNSISSTLIRFGSTCNIPIVYGSYLSLIHI